MKLAMPSLSKDALLHWLLDHAEKIVGVLVLILAMWMAWNGVNIIRSQSVSADLKPDAIVAKAADAVTHIDSQPQPPEEKLLQPIGLRDSIEMWLTPQEKKRRTLVFKRPLSDELARRTKPEVFPVEDLRAVSGVAVLAVPTSLDEAESRPSRSGLGPPGQAESPERSDPAENVPPARIVPYVLVTGLIPYAKQATDYLERFGNASFQNPKRDAPLWSDFLIERADVTSGTGGPWERINPRAVRLAHKSEWAEEQPDSLPARFFLTADQQPNLGNLTYAWPLPKLAMESWGPEAIHPWTLAEWRRQRDSRPNQTTNPTQAIVRPTTPFGGGGQGFPELGDPLSAGFGMEPLFDPGGAADDDDDQLDFRLFRFFDTSVKAGRVYRYRVRVSLWNPNHGVLPQHLAQADLAEATKLPSPPSNETASVMVPDTMEVLARVPPTEPKRDSAEVLVLWPHEKTGNFALHSVTTVPGGVVSVQRMIEQEENDDRGRPRPGRGRQGPATEPVPVGMLVDFIGQQTPAEAPGQQPAGRRRKKSAPAEPFELLMLGEDNRLSWASTASSEERCRLYADTLPAQLRSVPTDSPGSESDPGSLFPGFQ